MDEKQKTGETVSPKWRPVPWSGFDVALIFLLWISLMNIGVRFATSGIGGENAVPDAAPKATTEHMQTQLIRHSAEQPIMLLAAFFSAVLLAPVTEELLFRLIFQGWLQKRTAIASTAFPKTAYPYLSGGVSIFTVSIAFAVMHGGQRTEQPVEVLFYGMLGVMVANLLTCFFMAAYLSRVHGARMADFGLVPQKIPTDLLLGIGVFALCGPAILALNLLLRNLFPETVTDPVPIFFFAVVLGTLFYRTGRLLPCIVLHACLNGFSFTVLLLEALSK